MSFRRARSARLIVLLASLGVLFVILVSALYSTPILGVAPATLPKSGCILVTVACVVATVSVGSNPELLAIDPSNGYVYVSNRTASISVIDGATNKVIGSITIGGLIGGLAHDSMNGYMYLAGKGLNTVYEINGTNTVVGYVSVAPEQAPSSVAFDSSNGYLYVTDFYSSAVSVIRPASTPTICGSSCNNTNSTTATASTITATTSTSTSTSSASTSTSTSSSTPTSSTTSAKTTTTLSATTSIETPSTSASSVTSSSMASATSAVTGLGSADYALYLGAGAVVLIIVAVTAVVWRRRK